jgi:uncharacterized phage protein (predicted DNA packaging)
MTIDLAAVKSYCRIDWDTEDELLTALVAAAKDYLDGAGVPEPEADNPMYALAVKAMVLEFYDHRGQTESDAGRASLSAIPGMSNLIVQLKLRAEAERVVGDGG